MNRRPGKKKSERPRGTLWQWEYDGDASGVGRPQTGRHEVSTIVGQWEREHRLFAWKWLEQAWAGLMRNSGRIAALTIAFVLGALIAAGPNSAVNTLQMRQQLRTNERTLTARQGELELARLQLARLNTILANSSNYRIPADLAASIYDIARAEGIDPHVAFGLVSVESEFYRKAVSSKGAVGLTQVMPATARTMEPGISRDALFDRETNLRLGFRFLREMLDYYNGDLHLALTAYNRGPTTVDRIRREGGDPNNGYSGNVLREGEPAIGR